MTLPTPLIELLRNPHELDRAVDALTEYLTGMADAEQRVHIQQVVPTASGVLGVRTPDLRRIVNEITRVLAQDDHQLAKVMSALWRGPAVEHRAIAALCCDALGRADLKRLLRFLQQAERRLGDWASCDALVSGCREHVRANPDLFLREASNRISSRRPYIRRLGIVLLTPLATDPRFTDLPALLHALKPVMMTNEPPVQKACAWLLRDLHRRDPALVDGFVQAFENDPAARGTLTAYRAKLRPRQAER